MGMWTKILLGAVLTALLGWLSYSSFCEVDGANRGYDENATVADGADDESAVAAAVDPVVAQKVESCQTGVDAVLASKTMEFRSGSAYISPAIAATITEIAGSLKDCAGTQVEVQGHTDLTGSADVNQRISQARADAVVAELVKQGVPAAQLSAKGFGSSKPLVNAQTGDANAKNRRTVLVVTASAAPTEGQ